MWGQPKAAPASEVPASYVPVSRKRWLLAIYMDYVVFGAVWELIVHLVAPGREFTVLRYLTFALLEAMLLGLFRWSPGEYLLSITFPRHPYDPIAPEGAEPHKGGRRPVVDARVRANESFLTMAVGVLYVVEGAKSLVRWTMWSPPQPFFGTHVGPSAWPAIAVALGVLSLFVGALVLRLHRWAPAIVAATSALSMVSAAVSWQLWDEYVIQTVNARRAYQGIPVRKGEVAFMQALMPEAAMIVAAIAIVIVWAYRARFERYRVEDVGETLSD